MRNAKMATVFDELNTAMETHRNTVERILKGFTTDADRITKKYEPYRDSEKLTRDGIAELIPAARKGVMEASAELSKALTTAADALENELVSQTARPCSEQFLRMLRQYTEFGITPGKTETEALILLAERNLVPERILYHILKKLNAPYTFQPRSIDDLEANITTLRAAAASATDGPVFPLNLLHEGNMIFSDYGELVTEVDNEDGHYSVSKPFIQAEPIRDEAGNVLGSWDLDKLTVQAGQYDHFVKRIQEMRPAWEEPEQFPDITSAPNIPGPEAERTAEIMEQHIR